MEPIRLAATTEYSPLNSAASDSTISTTWGQAAAGVAARDGSSVRQGSARQAAGRDGPPALGHDAASSLLARHLAPACRIAGAPPRPNARCQTWR